MSVQRGRIHLNPEAVKWYRQAAAQGNARAQFNLGVLYVEGLGVAQNYAEAAKWFRLAAAQWNPDSACGVPGGGVNRLAVWAARSDPARSVGIFGLICQHATLARRSFYYKPRRIIWLIVNNFYSVQNAEFSIFSHNINLANVAVEFIYIQW